MRCAVPSRDGDAADPAGGAGVGGGLPTLRARRCAGVRGPRGLPVRLRSAASRRSTLGWHGAKRGRRLCAAGICCVGRPLADFTGADAWRHEPVRPLAVRGRTSGRPGRASRERLLPGPHGRLPIS